MPESALFASPTSGTVKLSDLTILLVDDLNSVVFYIITYISDSQRKLCFCETVIIAVGTLYMRNMLWQLDIITNPLFGR